MSRLAWYRFSWVLYLVGSLLVFGSWVDLVPAGIGWCGWLAAILGWCIGTFGRPARSTCQTPPPACSKADELEKLALLHKEGVLTDYEFQREKQRILRQP